MTGCAAGWVGGGGEGAWVGVYEHMCEFMSECVGGKCVTECEHVHIIICVCE